MRCSQSIRCPVWPYLRKINSQSNKMDGDAQGSPLLQFAANVPMLFQGLRMSRVKSVRHDRDKQGLAAIREPSMLGFGPISSRAISALPDPDSQTVEVAVQTAATRRKLVAAVHAAQQRDGSTTASLFEEVLRRVAVLEDAMTKLPSSHGGIGHNQPPEAIEPAPFAEADRRTIEFAMAILKAQPAQPPARSVEVEKAVDELKSIGDRIRQYVAKQTDEFVSAAIKAAAGEAGKRIVQLPLWALLAKCLIEVADAVEKWLAAIAQGM
jgi:hypothetical protein